MALYIALYIYPVQILLLFFSWILIDIWSVSNAQRNATQTTSQEALH